MATKKSIKIHNCYFCDYNTSCKRDFNKHLSTAKHKTATSGNQKVHKEKSYQCSCGLSYKHRGSLHKHMDKCPKSRLPIDINRTKLFTETIKGNIEGDNNYTEFQETTSGNQKVHISIPYQCSCGKSYKHRGSMHKHMEKCPKTQSSGTAIDQNILFEMLKGNAEFQKMMLEQQKIMMEEQQKTIREMIPKLGSNNNSNNTNILFMLNEKCKDAMNMSDFLKTLEITLEHLNSTKDGGLAKGVIYTFLDKIKQLDIHERPIHCSDVKRETLYIKDNDLWMKDKDHAKMKYAINRIAFLQRKSLDIWTKANPGYEASSARSNDEYLKLLKNSMQCLIEKNEEGKVIRNICKDIHIDKEEI